ncbi:MAG TPA: hypothetical protein PLV21_10440 [Cyclobacteriaceae bacterium]|nr:hypothetical protein [Cyclobacteriaceae bacterium]HRJ82294.1 hypothetical protein [Cyclobacteriaceae bacterium]
MKRIISISVVLILFIAWLLLDYSLKKEKFKKLKDEYELSVDFGQTVGLINNYFFEHGWFPDSLKQVDTIFNREVLIKDLDDVKETRYWFLIDPFSGKFYHYIPVMNEKYKKPEGYYLISAGIDSKVDNNITRGTLKLYDSVSFNYWDAYFGKKDLLVKEGLIRDWIREPFGMEVTLKWFSMQYDPTGKRMPRNVRFNGVVENINDRHFLLRDTQSNLKAICYLFIDSNDQLVSGDTIQVNGIYNKATFNPDTIFTFLNCIVIGKK